MKRVSFEAAISLKAAGYPQIGEYWYDRSGLCCYSESDLDELQNYFYVAPTYLEVWIWLWREKKCYIQTDLCFRDNDESAFVTIDKANNVAIVNSASHDPEESIIAAIEYLVENNLIK